MTSMDWNQLWIDFNRFLIDSKFYITGASKFIFVHHEMNAYFYVCKLRELISPKLNWFQSASVNSEIIILSCDPFCTDTEEKPGPVPLMRCIVRDPAATDANVDPTRGLAGARARAYVRTHTYARTKVYGREHGREEKKTPGRGLSYACTT